MPGTIGRRKRRRGGALLGVIPPKKPQKNKLAAAENFCNSCGTYDGAIKSVGSGDAARSSSSAFRVPLMPGSRYHRLASAAPALRSVPPRPGARTWIRGASRPSPAAPGHSSHHPRGLFRAADHPAVVFGGGDINGSSYFYCDDAAPSLAMQTG